MKDEFGVLQALALLTQIGLVIMIPIVLGVYLGNRIDNYLETEPIFLVIFILLGVFFGFKNAYRLLMP